MENSIIIIDNDQNVFFDLYTSSLFLKNIPYSDSERLSFYQEYKNIRQKKQNELLNQNNRKITSINIIPTYNCDGRCSYCYNSDINNNYYQQDLTIDKIEKHMNNLISQNIDITNVTSIRFYGGEPLLNKNLYDIIMYFQNKYQPVIHISSGLLFSDDIFNTNLIMLKKLKEQFVNFSITTTIDFGSDPYTRNYKDSNIDSYNMLQNRLKLLLQNGIKVVYATVINKNTNINLLEEQLIKTYNDIKSFDDVYNIQILSTENVLRPFSFRFSVANDNIFYPSIVQVNLLYDLFKKLYNKFPIISNLYPYSDVVCGSTIKKIEEDIYTFIYPPTRCGVYTYMIEIFPDKLGVCHMNVDDSQILFTKNSPIYDQLYTNINCNDCMYELICRKGCPYRKLYAPLANESYCQWIKYSFELAWQRIYEMCSNDKNKLKTYIEKYINKKVII